MRAFLAVLSLELYRRRLVFVIGLAFGLVVTAIPLLPGIHSHSPADLRGVAAVVGAFGYALLLAVGLGGSFLLRDLSERRLSFYFSRPVSGGSFWLGRVISAMLAILGGALLILLPAMLIGGNLTGPDSVPRLLLSSSWSLFAPEPWQETPSLLALWALGFGGLLLVLLCTNAFALAARSKSAWLVLDLTAAIWLLGGSLALSKSMLTPFAAHQTFNLLVTLAGAGLLGALLFASLAQVLAGRTDLLRAHRAHALFFASLIALVAGTTLAAAYRVTHSMIGDLSRWYSATELVEPGWISVVGVGRWSTDVAAEFLVELSSGRSFRTSVGTAGIMRTKSTVIVGSSVFWLEQEEGGVRLFRSTLAEGRHGRSATSVVLPVWPTAIAISDQEGLVAAILPAPSRNTLIVADRTTGRILSSSLTDLRVPALRFEAGELRALSWASVRGWVEADTGLSPEWIAFDEAMNRLLARRLAGQASEDTAGESATQLRAVSLSIQPAAERVLSVSPFLLRPSRVELSPLGDHLILMQQGFPAVLVDALTLKPIAALAPPITAQSPEWSFDVAAFLPTGNSVAVGKRPGEVEVAVFSTDGSLLHSRQFRVERSLVLAGLDSYGSSVIAAISSPAWRGSGLDEEWRVERLDLVSGRTDPLENGVHILGRYWQGESDLSPLIFERNGTLFVFDPKTEERRTIH